MFGDGSFTLREFAIGEPLPLAAIHEEILQCLRKRPDVALFGAQAVNAYVDQPRMTQLVDIVSTRAEDFAEELRSHLADRFHIAARTRTAGAGSGFRVYQLREPKYRHLADVCPIAHLPPTQLVSEIQVPIPEEVIAQKVIAFSLRRDQPKSGTNWRDILILLQTFPAMKVLGGAVSARLSAASANSATTAAWEELVRSPIPAAEDDGY